jgi:hypothetical protein
VEITVGDKVSTVVIEELEVGVPVTGGDDVEVELVEGVFPMGLSVCDPEVEIGRVPLVKSGGGGVENVPLMLMLTLVVLTTPGPSVTIIDVVDIVVVVEELLTSPSIPVLLYSVRRIRSPWAFMICLLTNREGEEGWETLPPHFCVGSPGQVVLHAEIGYSIKSSEGSVGRE